jgi:hypothetical protein
MFLYLEECLEILEHRRLQRKVLSRFDLPYLYRSNGDGVFAPRVERPATRVSIS